MSDKLESPLVAILGPTASGKSALGIWLAQQLGGDVVACDSTQLYRGFDVGTAKPAPTERGGVAHHLIDVLDASEEADRLAGVYIKNGIIPEKKNIDAQHIAIATVHNIGIILSYNFKLSCAGHPNICKLKII